MEFRHDDTPIGVYFLQSNYNGHCFTRTFRHLKGRQTTFMLLRHLCML
ncbi:hypothetical protein LSH36_427g04012 [Paralvinella palmiformis]|uniref:Uncharacterized protein n=1 Tax=Paralvinella palmiformis TaxID=53620 RepID=A0AAD9MZM0_9ANNE|nr:hypothetical protein LSH36_427g04012 [Paralvinella palmiformis]